MRRPTISIARTVEVYETMVDLRRQWFEDNEFFMMSDVLERLCDCETDGSEDVWRIKTFKRNPANDFSRKVGVITFEGSVTLSMDQRFLEKARKGCKLCNFILAHEIGHLALEHHDTNAKIMNFQLYKGPKGFSNFPPTKEELEADYAAFFFQCGVALADHSLSPKQLSKWAYLEQGYVGKAQKMVRLPEFQRILNRPKPKYPRILL